MENDEGDVLDAQEGELDNRPLGAAIALSASFGVVAGILMGNIALGLAFGPAIGVILHALGNAKAQGS